MASVQTSNVIDWYLQINRICREIRTKAVDAAKALREGDSEGVKVINGYLTDYDRLSHEWEKQFSARELGNLGRHIYFGKGQDYEDILNRDISQVEDRAEKRLSEVMHAQREIGFESLLHPVIVETHTISTGRGSSATRC